MQRVFLGTLLALGLTFAGFLAGGVLAGQSMSRTADGLAGATTAALGAFAGAAAGLILGIVLARRIATPILGRLGTLVGLADIAVVVFLVARAAPLPAPVQDTLTVAQQDTTPPPLPPAGTPDSLLGLVTVAPESLPRFETREHDYEVSSVTVYRQVGDWYLAGAKDGGRTWLHTRATGRFFPLEELVVNRLNLLTQSWDTRLRDAPDPNSPARDVPVPRAGGQEVPANVLETRRAGGTLWLRVEVQARSPCEGETPAVVATGWIPAWGGDGKPTAWFYSRGC